MIWSGKIESIPGISFILPVYNMEHLPPPGAAAALGRKPQKLKGENTDET